MRKKKQKLVVLQAEIQDGTVYDINCFMCGKNTFLPEVEPGQGYQCPRCLIYTVPRKGVRFIEKEAPDE